MRIVGISLIALLILAPVAGAENVGSIFGAMSTAKATGKGQTTFSGTIGLTDHTSFLGSVNYGLSDRVDGRLRIGVVDADVFDTAIALGADVRWQIWDEDKMGAPSAGVKQKPFDMAVGGFMEWIDLDAEALGTFLISQTVFQMGGQVTGSHVIHFSNGGTLAPYGRLNLRYESQTIEFPTGTLFTGKVSESHMALGLNGGVAWGPTRNILLFGELQIDGNDGIFLGIDYKL